MTKAIQTVFSRSKQRPFLGLDKNYSSSTSYGDQPMSSISGAKSINLKNVQPFFAEGIGELTEEMLGDIFKGIKECDIEKKAGFISGAVFYTYLGSEKSHLLEHMYPTAKEEPFNIGKGGIYKRVDVSGRKQPVLIPVKYVNGGSISPDELSAGYPTEEMKDDKVREAACVDREVAGIFFGGKDSGQTAPHLSFFMGRARQFLNESNKKKEMLGWMYPMTPKRTNSISAVSRITAASGICYYPPEVLQMVEELLPIFKEKDGGWRINPQEIIPFSFLLK